MHVCGANGCEAYVVKAKRFCLGLCAAVHDTRLSAPNVHASSVWSVQLSRSCLVAHFDKRSCRIRCDRFRWARKDMGAISNAQVQQQSKPLDLQVWAGGHRCRIGNRSSAIYHSARYVRLQHGAVSQVAHVAVLVAAGELDACAVQGKRFAVSDLLQEGAAQLNDTTPQAHPLTAFRSARSRRQRCTATARRRCA